MVTRGVDEDDLGVRDVVEALDTVARSLRLVGGDDDLLADDGIEEGRFTDVRAADNRDIS